MQGVKFNKRIIRKKFTELQTDRLEKSIICTAIKILDGKMFIMLINFAGSLCGVSIPLYLTLKKNNKSN